MLFPVGPLKISIVQKANATALAVSLVGHASTGWIGADGTVNPTITIPHGELLNITTSSGDGKQHEFYVDVDGNGIRDYPVDLIADPTPSTTTLSIPSCATISGYLSCGTGARRERG